MNESRGSDRPVSQERSIAPTRSLKAGCVSKGRWTLSYESNLTGISIVKLILEQVVMLDEDGPCPDIRGPTMS